MATSNEAAESGAVICDCSENVYNCSDFETLDDAQECYDYCFEQTGEDVHLMDGDPDGVVCDGDIITGSEPTATELGGVSPPSSTQAATNPPPTTSPATQAQPTQQPPTDVPPTQAPTQAPPTEKPAVTYECGSYRACTTFSSCGEAHAWHAACPGYWGTADGDNDGVICENVCPGG